jgi:hypothetical protein
MMRVPSKSRSPQKPEPILRPDSRTGLYWSIRGEVACARHAPDLANPRWATEG